MYLADRIILIDQPKDGFFAAFREQAPAEDERRHDIFTAFPQDFFDLVDRRRVSQRQRTRRGRMAGDPRPLRAGVSTRNDGDATSRPLSGLPRILWQPALHLQPPPRHRGRVSRALPRTSCHYKNGTRSVGAPAKTNWIGMGGRFSRRGKKRHRMRRLE